MTWWERFKTVIGWDWEQPYGPDQAPLPVHDCGHASWGYARDFRTGETQCLACHAEGQR